MSERNVLAAALSSRSAYEKLVDHIEDGELGEQGRILLAHIAEYYDSDPDAQSTDPEIVSGYIARSLSNPKHIESFDLLVHDLAAMEVSPPNIVKDILGVKREAAGNRLASALAAGRNVQEIVPLLTRYEQLAEAETLEKEESVVYNARSVRELVDRSFSDDALIKVWPPSLNDRLDGGLLRGHHLVLYARPEIGKTLLLVNMLAGFLHQGLKVLYCGNEDPMDDINMRVITRLTETIREDVVRDPDAAEAIANQRGYELLFLADLSPGTPREIDALTRQLEPDVVMIDQLRNLNVGEDHFVQQLEKAATAARNIAKSRNVLMVSVTQAGSTAEHKAVLDMSDVDSSKTGIPAQADVMVGIGADEEDMGRNRRVVSLPKNKRSGIHDTFPITIVPQISKVKGYADELT